jgi:hypothetical protein
MDRTPGHENGSFPSHPPVGRVGVEGWNRMIKPKRSAEFHEKHKQLKADRPAREAGLKAKGK